MRWSENNVQNASPPEAQDRACLTLLGNPRNLQLLSSIRQMLCALVEGAIIAQENIWFGFVMCYFVVTGLRVFFFNGETGRRFDFISPASHRSKGARKHLSYVNFRRPCKFGASNITVGVRALFVQLLLWLAGLLTWGTPQYIIYTPE